MNKIAMKMVDLNIKTAAGITPSMMTGNIFRNLGKMVKGTFNEKVMRGAANNMGSAMNLYGRELAATRGKSSPKGMKNLLKNFHSTNKMQNIANKFGKPAMADNFGTIGKANLDTYLNVKRGINPFPNLNDFL